MPITKPSRVQQLFIRYQNMAGVFTFLQEKDLLPLLTPTLFVESRQKKINSLLKKKVFKVISISELQQNIKIFNSCFINRIKNIEVANAFEKLRLVVQIYNDHDKMSILI